MKMLVLCLVLSFLGACAHVPVVQQFPDPECPEGYTWVTREGDAGACLNDEWSLTKDCITFRDPSASPAYAFWSCGGGVHTAR